MSISLFRVATVLVLGAWMLFVPAPASADTFVCQFHCRPTGTQGPGTPVGAQIPCTGETQAQHTFCGTQCTQRCPRPGSGPDQNGLTQAAGTGLTCTDVNSARCVRVPSAGSAPAPTTTTGGTTTGAGRAIALQNPIGITSITELFGRIVQAFLGILGSLALFWFVWGSIVWMTAADSKRHEEAKTIMKNAALGVLIIFFSYGLTTAFLSIFEQIATQSSSSRRITPPPPPTR